MKNPHADKEIGLQFTLMNDEFFQYWSKTTFLKIIENFYTGKLSEFYKYTFEELKNIPSETGPKFIFSHILIPHYPYIFKSDGSVNSEISLVNQFSQSQWKLEDEYIDQMIYLNKVILEIVDSILKKSKIKPVILIQSDHGPTIPKLTDEDEKRSARFANLNAIYLPNFENQEVFKDVTPVNNFRYIFNHLFNAKLPILPNKSYWSLFTSPYSFKEFDIEAGKLIEHTTQ